ncbi:MAG: YwbE family protein [Candidatus Heimdallarchaeota archaeon]|nr:YwbE family protein [Candidatus Heimdallarchaeota archaeon]
MPSRTRKNIHIGANVSIVEKHNQRTGELTTGIVKTILTNSSSHPHGIKVRLESGKMGRVKSILDN